MEKHIPEPSHWAQCRKHDLPQKHDLANCCELNCGSPKTCWNLSLRMAQKDFTLNCFQRDQYEICMGLIQKRTVLIKREKSEQKQIHAEKKNRIATHRKNTAWKRESKMIHCKSKECRDHRQRGWKRVERTRTRAQKVWRSTAPVTSWLQASGCQNSEAGSGCFKHWAVLFY